MTQRAVVLLSGGLDSATALAIAKSQGFECYAISFDYGQRHRIELKRAAEQAELQGVAQIITVPIDLRMFGGSALTADIDVPKGRMETPEASQIPITYVPARNTVFLSFALAWAEVLEARDIFIGVNALDYSGYPDCRPEFITSFEEMANLATRAGVEGKRLKIHVPLLMLAKSEIIQVGIDLGVDYSKTSSCYDPGPNGEPCRACDSCYLRERGFEAIWKVDPLISAAG